MQGRLKLEPRFPIASATYYSCDFYNDDTFHRSLDVSTAGAGWIGAAVGYGISSRAVVSLGARVAVSESEHPGTSTTYSVFDLGPELSVLLTREGEVRPFLTAALSGGVDHVNDGDGIIATRVAGALGAGLQLRVSDRVSVNPVVAAAYGHQGGALGRDFTCRSLALNGLLGVAAWL